MQRDFHYYAIWKLACLAGFGPKEATTVAYASQYVDDATESEPVKPYPSREHYFDTVRTAHYDLEAILWDVQKKIYMPFHFLPTTIRREEPGSFSYITEKALEPKAKLAKKIVAEARREKDQKLRLIRLGVALHAVADTFAHFGFSGRLHTENDVKGIWFAENGKWDFKELMFLSDIFIPKIGHAEASHCPDVSSLHWQYKNAFGGMIDRENLGCCMECAEYIFRILCAARSNSKKSLEKSFPADYGAMENFFGNKGDLGAKCDLWLSYTKARKYDEMEWREAALQGDIDWNGMSRSRRSEHLGTLIGKKGFDTSDWAYFHRAAQRQRNLVIDWIN